MEVSSNQHIVRTGVERDRELVDGLRGGEPSAVEDLVATYGDRAYRLAIRITLNKPDAEEVVQDAFWAVVRKIDTFQGEAAFGSWFYRIVANNAYQKLRGRARRGTEVSLDEVLPHLDDHDPVADWSWEVEDPAVQGELRAVLAAAIDKLPAAYRAVLLLRDVEGLSTRESASTLETNVCNIKARVHRARLFLRKRLATYMAVAPVPTKHDRVT